MSKLWDVELASCLVSTPHQDEIQCVLFCFGSNGTPLSAGWERGGQKLWWCFLTCPCCKWPGNVDRKMNHLAVFMELSESWLLCSLSIHSHVIIIKLFLFYTCLYKSDWISFFFFLFICYVSIFIFLFIFSYFIGLYQQHIHTKTNPLTNSIGEKRQVLLDSCPIDLPYLVCGRSWRGGGEKLKENLCCLWVVWLKVVS